MTRRPINHDALVGMMQDVGVNMVDKRPPSPFRARKLYDDLVAERQRRRIETDREVARQAGKLSPSTLTRLKHGQDINAVSLGKLLEWLGNMDLAPYWANSPARSSYPTRD